MGDKQRGNTAYMAGDVDAALRHYNAGIDRLRALTLTHLQRNVNNFLMAATTQVMDCLTPSDPAAVVVMARNSLATIVQFELYPYQPESFVTAMEQQAAAMFTGMSLPPIARLPGCTDMASLIGSFWAQLNAKFQEPYGGAGGLLAYGDSWKHPSAAMCLSQDFDPIDH
jgi:hypothetical protein